MKKLTHNVLKASILACVCMSSAIAATATANFQVTATVQAACTVAATNVAFGAVTPATTGNVTSTGTITATCTKSTPYSLNINVGSTTGGTYAQRQMAGTASNTDKFNYNLYTTSSYDTVFGDGTGSTENISLTGNGASQATTVYGRASLNQYIKPDTYTDSLTVTLSY